ncbi:MAG: TonB-dependent receptor [Ignavibacteriae bacterium]|nr:TonB-dependent receptor [Ignavibacteriota bacterium]
MKNILIIFLFCVSAIFPQKLKGIVYENIGENISPLPGVNIFWENTTIGTTSNADGSFEIIKTSADSSKLIVSYVTFKPDTIIVKKSETFIEIILTENLELDEITVLVKTKGTEFDDLNPILTQTLFNKEFKKAACCNLSESFETNASVDVSYSDAVSGAKQIKLLGLDGKYGQIMTENIPNLRGLASAYGIYFVPGPWMESIQISKGTASVINGFESTTGQINIEFKKSILPNSFYADLFSTDQLKNDVNAITTINIDENISTSLFLHGEYFGKNVDHNKDGFLDHPNVRQINILNRWNYEDFKNWHIAATLNYINEERYGGQIGFGSKNNFSKYRNIIKTERFQIWSKIGYMFSNDLNSSFGFINMLTTHKQNSSFGNRIYNSDELSYYSNLIFESQIINQKNKINTGISLVYDNLNELFIENNFDKKEFIPGAFFQYTFQPEENLALISGVRADFNNKFGMFITPRFHARYSPLANTTLRFTIGKGYRSSNIISENISFLSSSRNFIIDENLKMENAINYGFNITQYFYFFDKELSINADFYRTEFINKVVVDIDQNSHEVNFYNLDGKSFANNFQVELNYELIKNLDLTGAVRFSDAKTTFNGNLISDPLNKKFKGLLSLSYLSNLRLWQFDFTTQFNGSSRIPKLAENITLENGTKSPSFINMMAQITHYLKGWEVFLGIENFTNFTQSQIIISADDPFGPDYDSSMIWGPIEGRKFYLGFRLTLK